MPDQSSPVLVMTAVRGDSLAASQKRGDPLLDLFRRKGFSQVSFRSCRERFNNPCFATLGSNHHNRDSPCRVDRGEIPEELQAVHHRHVDVAQDHIDRLFLNCSESFGAVAGFEDFRKVETGLAQRALDDLSHD